MEAVLPEREGARLLYSKMRAGVRESRRAPRYAVRDLGYGTPCYVWLGTRTKRGYGRMVIRGRDRLVHTVAFEAVHGPVPTGKVPDHLCRNRACFRPDHLEAVSQAVNVRRGNSTKLNARDVAEIRASELSSRRLANTYGVSHQQICNIKSRRRWR